ncbi:restriction endonuclease subunit S [Staphylococcus warneri]|uniref:restriction endonuclease subunit S n=1 Tax=Staphylococcus warneri TaxID=1292 RepID=UPI002556C56D|nr:restriction endonuclease subunit S [Staphylococcus warneri]MDK7334059.1 restriction endonuclease subunit S [Staphylococcus warneri]MDK7961498.1 restriction endonuclease subunit S [Staphylococcus warneri]
MMKLSDREWKVFDFLEVFNIVDGYYNKKPPINLEINSNNIPFLAATKNNNGLTGFINKSIVKKYDKVGNISNKYSNRRFFSGKCLAITNNGSVGNVYYQDTEFTCSHDITVLYLKNFEINKFIALFLIPLLKKTGSKYAYANKWRPKRMKKSKILLPVDDQCNPDYGFMEQYVKEKYFNLKSQIKEKQKHEITDWRELDEVDWDNYFIESLFQIKSGKRLTKKEFTIGKTPFIGSSDHNNGITNFVDNRNSSEDFNVLGVNYNGSVVENFYHPYTALFSDDVKRLSLKSKGNKYKYLFIKNMILKQKEKYQYGYKFNGERMKKQIIKLPSFQNQPDYDFMEQYMKRKENEILDRI